MAGEKYIAEEGLNFLGKLFRRGANAAPEVINTGRKISVDGLNDFVLGVTPKLPSRRSIRQGARIAESAFGKGNPLTSSITDILEGTTKNRNIFSRLPKKVKVGVPAAIAGLGIINILRGQTVPTPTPIDYSKVNFGNNVNNTQAAIDAYIKNAQQAIIDSYSNMPGTNVPGAEMYNPISGMVNQVGGASVAEMQKLAGLAAQQAGAIQAGGAQGAASINDIYGDVSGQLSDIASYGGEYGAMTPVSGAMATAPAEAVAQGQNLADYLRQGQMITSQDAGFLAGLAPMLGTGYANQLAMMDYAARQQAAIRQQQLQQQMAYDRAQAQQNALLELALQGQQLGLESQLSQPGRNFIDPSSIQAYAAQYDEIVRQGNDSALKAQGINSVEDFINAQIAASLGA